MTRLALQLLDPISRKPLRFTAVGDSADFGYWADDDCSQRWPEVLGIAFLRADRIELAEIVANLIESQQKLEAVGELLQDTDDFAPLTPDLNDCVGIAERLLASDHELHPREMMEILQFGPVVDYFALRGSSPTFFSGLGLLKLGARKDRPLIEVGCGVGHFLYWLQVRGIDVVGTDSVFSKLCLANRFMGVSADQLVCAVAGNKASLPIATSEATSVFCHDAFYFIEDKERALSDFRRLAGPDGAVIVGHAHISTADHGSVLGYPLTLAAYRQLASVDAHFFDDAALVAVGASTGPLDDHIAACAEAVAFVEDAAFHEDLDETPSSWWSHEGELLHAPMEVTWGPAERSTRMNWPSEAFANEYRSADYLVSSKNPFEYLPTDGTLDPKAIHPGLTVPTKFLEIGVKPLRWGVIGGGWIAGDYFVPAFESIPHAQLVGLADLSDERRSAFAEIADLRSFEDWREMLACCELDAVYIATPNDSHAEIFEGVAAAGLRILCEKPIATNENDLQRIRACAEQNPRFFQTAFDQRYHPAHLQLARRIAEGALGTVTQIRVQYACWVDSAWTKVAATDNWRIDPIRAGGGAGFDLLPHCLDLISVLVSEPITAANLLYQGRVHDYALSQTIDDGALMVIKTEGSVLASIHVGYNCPEDQPRRRIEVIGTGGRVEAIDTMGQDAGGELIWQTPSGELRETFPTTVEAGPFVRQLDAVSRLWIRGNEPQFPFEQDLTLAELLISCDTQARLNSVSDQHSLDPDQQRS